MELLTIGEVAERTGIAPSALRFYETRGLVQSERSDGNQRRYHRDMLRRLSFIKVAQNVGLTLDDIAAALATLPDERTPTKEDWSRLSRSWGPVLDDQIAVLQRLRDKLDGCIGCGCLSLKSCALYNPDDVAGDLGPGPRWVLTDDGPDES
ncbi:MAG: MerR family transcriptional regulator, redox-sensitive transcriptional activator SoxR [Actinomycetota bacterium]|nr:MerR family transcriptional regulator, redox-sensitive transcriptional activator SoxR [Actinomycetota bacterium]